MGKFFDHIPANIVPWINSQRMFWVATAPLAEDGHVNVSPKGVDNTMHIVLDDLDEDEKYGTSRSAWYEDLTGSGVETISHLRENGRLTIMFTAFEGPPQIVRLFGTGKVYEFGTPEYDALLPPGKRQPGSRAVIWIDVHKVGTSCGFSVPFYTYKSPRVKLHKISTGKEQADCDYACSEEYSSAKKKTFPETGLKSYWGKNNVKSIDGIPALEFAFMSENPLGDWRARGVVYGDDDERIPSASNRKPGSAKLFAVTSMPLGVSDLGKVLFGFGAGFVASAVLSRLVK